MLHRVDAGEGAASTARERTPGKEEAVRAQMKRLLADPLFHNSRRYSNLLRYIVGRSLEGQFDSLKERVIGIEVFGRAPDYDTSIDPTVRVAATEVRKRLALYYSQANHKDELHIDVPVRSYVAEFSDHQGVHAPSPEPAVLPQAGLEKSQIDVPPQEPVDASPPAVRSRSKYWYPGLFGAIVLATAVIVACLRMLSPQPPLNRFWAPMLTGSDPTLICISSSPSAVPSDTPEQSKTNENKAELKLYEFASQRVNVSMTDVAAANSLAQFLHTHGKDSIIRPARGTNLADLRDSPVVLFGSFTNDWVIRLGAGLHYRVKKDSDFGVRWIEDSSDPSSKVWAVDMSAPNEQVANDYALVSRVLDRSTGRWWIGISGLTGIGTLAAYQLTMDPKALLALTSELPKGWENKNLQFVVQVPMIQGSPGASRVIAKYTW